DDRDPWPRRGLAGDGDVVDVLEGDRSGAAIDRAADIEDDGSPDAGHGSAAGHVLVVKPVTERTGNEVIGIGGKRGDMIDIAAAPADGVGAKALGAGKRGGCKE